MCVASPLGVSYIVFSSGDRRAGGQREREVGDTAAHSASSIISLFIPVCALWHLWRRACVRGVRPPRCSLFGLLPRLIGAALEVVLQEERGGQIYHIDEEELVVEVVVVCFH